MLVTANNFNVILIFLEFLTSVVKVHGWVDQYGLSKNIARIRGKYSTVKKWSQSTNLSIMSIDFKPGENLKNTINQIFYSTLNDDDTILRTNHRQLFAVVYLY